ncbi:MAG TPA: NB-ARC domain-containing protein [Bryobacteraceae bacterium]
MPNEPPEKIGIFLSYARADGEPKAAEIRDRLQREAPDIRIKQDRLLLEGGVGWWKQITDAIDSVEFLVLVMTPAALTSGNVEKEWRYARQQGVCVYPVKGVPDSELQFGERTANALCALSKMPRWMSKAHFFDLDKEWPSFLAHLRKGCDKRRVPFMAPDLPPHFVPRPAEFGALKKLLLSEGRGQAVAITTAVTGAGGFGKTTLAAALCHDPDILEQFDDGILWVTLGQSPDVLRSLTTAFATLTGHAPEVAGEEYAALQLGEKLEQRNCLLVIDDVWNAAHLRPFLRGGKASARLFTTRDASIAGEASPVNVDEMSQSEAVALLTQGVAGLAEHQSQALAKRLGEWPLALEIASAMMRERVSQRDSASHAAEWLMQRLERKGPIALHNPAAEARHQTITSVVEASLDLLAAGDREHLAGLSIFPEDVAIPLQAAAAIWQLDEFDSEDLAQRLARLSLLKLDLQQGALRLHDVMRDWLRRSPHRADPAALHNRLVGSWHDWNELPQLPGQYAWRWLPWHLLQAGRKTDVERILWDPRWMAAKLVATDANALIADYEHLKPSPETELLEGALWLSSHVLNADARQFASQLAGRLLPHRDQPRIRAFLEQLGAAAPARWLRPMQPALYPPGARLLRTLEGHAVPVKSVAVTPDGRRAVSASSDNTLKVWDLETGRELLALEGHTGPVDGVMVMPDGHRVVSASDDKTLRVWDLETGRGLLALEGHAGPVNGVAVTPDGRRAVSASWDQTLKVWDLETGRELRTLEGHSSGVNGVAVTPDGRRVVSASGDRTLKVWDLKTGRELLALEGHSHPVTGVAVTPDGRRAVSASWDKTLKMWDLEMGRELLALNGHSSLVNSVAVTPDGRRAVSASYDRTLKVWDLERGRELLALEGHSGWVNGVAMTPDGRRVVSASHDKTLKVWDLETGRELLALNGHVGPVDAVAVTRDGYRTVSASYDDTLKVWGLETGRELLALEGHSNRVDGVAVTPDGRRAVSASWDKTLKVWDLETGFELLTLEGHSNQVYGVAVTPDGRRAVSASSDNTLKVWDLETGRELLALGGHAGPVYGVVVTPDGRLAVSASWDMTLKVWDLETGRELLALEGHSNWVYGVAVTPDSRRAVSASWDKTLKVWDLESGECLATFTCDADALCCASAAGGKIVAGDKGGRVHFLQLEERTSAHADQRS